MAESKDKKVHVFCTQCPSYTHSLPTQWPSAERESAPHGTPGHVLETSGWSQVGKETTTYCRAGTLLPT